MRNSSSSAFRHLELATPAKVKVANVVICPKCKKDSGFTREDLIHLSGNVELKCKQEGCGGVAARHVSKAKTVVDEIDREEFNYSLSKIND